ncbi:MAG: hypothetical protein ABIG61_07255 [Planctomycetota bacterium]
MKNDMILKTQLTPWLMFHDAPLANGTAKTFDLTLSATTTAGITGQWAKALLTSCWDAKNLENIFMHYGGVPNNIAITAWLEGCSANNSFKFRVDGFAGLGGDVDRLLLASAVVGTQRLFTRPIRPDANFGVAVSHTNSSMYADTLTETSSYNHTFIKLDAAGTNGKAKIHGDGLGIQFLAINLVSTIPNGAAAGFAIRGW